MAEETQRILFQDSPTFWLASNKFNNVPIVLQYGSVPLIEVGKFEAAGFTTRISIYHPDGTYLAKVVGSRLFSTRQGENAGVVMRHPDRMDVCEMGGRTLFEIRRMEAAALKTSAELFTPDGLFIKTSDEVSISGLVAGQEFLDFTVGPAVFVPQNLNFEGGDIGIHYVNKDQIVFAVNGKVSQNSGNDGPVLPVPGKPIASTEGVSTSEHAIPTASNVSITYHPLGDSQIASGLVTELDRALREIERQMGHLTVAALMKNWDDTGKCVILINGHWVRRGMPGSLEYIKRVVKTMLPPDDYSLISGYSLGDSDDPSLRKFQLRYGPTMGNGPREEHLFDPSSKKLTHMIILRCRNLT